MTGKFEMREMKGVIAAMITPFDENENVDAERTRSLVDFLLERGIDGFYLTGSTGEGFLMTAEERELAVRTVVKRVAGRKPVIVHIGDIGTRKSIALARGAYEAGADAVSSVPPFYWRFSEEDIYNYYRDVSEATPLPFVIYNIPLAGLMGTELQLRLAELPRVAGLKFTAKDHDQLAYLKASLGPDFMIYSGCDEMAFSGLAAGADGLIGSFYNAMPETFRLIYRSVQEGRLAEGARLQRIATEIILEALRFEYVPLIYSMIRWQGTDAGYPRRPFRSYTDAELADFKEKCRAVGERYGVCPDELRLLSCI